MRKSPDQLSFFEHVDELRGRLVKCLAALVITSCAFYPFVDTVLGFIVKPVGKLVFTAPSEAFTARMALTIYGGALLALPVFLYQIWQFVYVGLRETERKYVLFFAPVSLVLFFTGGLFAYFLMIPIALTFLMGFSSEIVQPMITVNHYISFVGSMFMAFGILFEMPLVILFLARIGVASPAFLAHKRREAIVLILIVSALVTPPDVITQLILAVPLLILYEISIIAAKFAYKESVWP